jgi:hypothetical protein
MAVGGMAVGGTAVGGTAVAVACGFRVGAVDGMTVGLLAAVGPVVGAAVEACSVQDAKTNRQRKENRMRLRIMGDLSKGMFLRD